jgi:hypothetical protein
MANQVNDREAPHAMRAAGSTWPELAVAFIGLGYSPDKVALAWKQEAATLSELVAGPTSLEKPPIAHVPYAIGCSVTRPQNVASTCRRAT